VSYQQPPDHRPDAPAGPPPGWYPDPGGLHALRWWDGARWGPQTQPMPGIRQEPQSPYPDASGSTSGGYGTFQHETAGRHRRQSGPQEGAAYAPGQAPASFPPAGAQAQPDPYQSQGPRVWPDQSPYPGPLQQSPLDGYPPHPGIQQSPSNAQPVRRRRYGVRRIVLIAGGTLIVLIAALVAVGMAGSHHQKAASASLSGASPGSPDCQSQDAAWAPGGERNQQAFSAALKKVESDDSQLSSDIQAGSTVGTTTLAGDLGALLGAVYKIKYDLPPSCIPGFAHDYGSAMDAYSNDSIYQTLAIGALNKGNTAGAQTDLALATASELAGNSAMQSALDDLDAFNASGS
jgi:Protein of unknown function (DUF2510)